MAFDEMVQGEATLWRDGRAVLAESLWWAEGHLHWCDISAGLLYRGSFAGSPSGEDDEVLEFEPPLASFHPRRGGGYVVALGDRVLVCDSRGRERREIARVDHAHEGMRFNEGKCDPAGWFQVGSMDITSGEADAAIYRFGAGGSETLLGGFGTANGFEWTEDRTVAYVTDTATQTIYRAAWTAEEGPGELQAFTSGRMHDGLTIDRDGCLWSGIYGAGEVVRLSPDGEVIGRVAIPVPNVTSVAFGGPDLSTLFVATARENLSEDQLLEFPDSGGIFSVATRTSGLPVRTFDA